MKRYTLSNLTWERISTAGQSGFVAIETANDGSSRILIACSEISTADSVNVGSESDFSLADAFLISDFGKVVSFNAVTSNTIFYATILDDENEDIISHFANDIYFESISKSPINIDFNHSEIHKGDHYFYSRVSTLASGATGDFVLEVGAKSLHFVYSINSDTAGFTFSTIEAITADANGTVLEINNNNRNKTDSSSAVLRYNPTNIVTSGKRIMRDGDFGTATNPNKASAGSVSRSDEVPLKPNTKYLLRITNKASSNNPINVGMTWYEV